MATQLDQARDVLARANRIIANEGVLDAFGHVSMRHPTDPGRYLLARSRAPELVQPDDILEFTLDSQPVRSTDVRLYGERVIHGGIYQARPDVNAVCHHQCAVDSTFLHIRYGSQTRLSSRGDAWREGTILGLP